MIDILVPVLNRPQNVRPLVDSISRNTRVPYRLIFLATAGDFEEVAELRAAAVNWTLASNGGEHDYPLKMNTAFRNILRRYDYTLLASDDLDFQPGWDTAVLDVAQATGAGVIGTNDKANGSVKRGQFSTHALVRRSYIEEHGGTMTDGPGVIFHEGYDHNFVDRELCGVAQHRGQWAFAKHSVIRHRHPNWKTAPMDSTYEKGLATFHRDQNLFFSRAHTWAYEGLNPAERRLARRAAIPGRR